MDVISGLSQQPDANEASGTGIDFGPNLGVADGASKTTWPSSPESFRTNKRSMNILARDCPKITGDGMDTEVV
ncbi:hypothetical protein MES5069_60069 [Mesorhizobium escarrei]|uniref:Uncharacterized protein n=1 Tax=Mesorhizobium escarrei TaxID=666018 RepID=A0ABN8KB02_9HYPH|nr:hypothetical protein MES5069_60069 [Mesorhizobium escarrei]